MNWVPWLYSGVLIVNAVAAVHMARMMREARQANRDLFVRLAMARTVIDVVLDRTDGLITCDGCGRPIVAEQAAAVRVTPNGTVFGHAVCLPPSLYDVA